MIHQSKCIALMKSLTTWEFKGLEQFIHSGYHNPNPQVIQLFNLIKPHYPQFESELPNYEKLSRLVFSKNKSNVPKLRHLLTDLTRIIERYLMQLEQEDNPMLTRELLSRQLLNRKCDKQFLQQIKEHNSQKSTTDISGLEHRVHLSELMHQYEATYQNRNEQQELQQLSDKLDDYYLTKKIKYCCEMLNRATILGITYHIPVLPYLLQYLNNHPPQLPLLRIYYCILFTITENENEQHYLNLKNLLVHRSSFTLRENKDIFAFAQNYCIRKLNTGKLEYLKELFEIYQTTLEERIIFDNNTLSHADFKNICAVAIRLHELKWVEVFINSYQKHLPSDLRHNSVSYNLARLYFAKRKYKEAIRLLTTVEFTDAFYHLDSKALLLKIYFETQSYDSLYALLNAFKIYVKRNKLLSTYQQTIYTNMINKTRLLTQLMAGDITLNTKVMNKINEIIPVADSSWVDEKTKLVLQNLT